ncbi:YybH family protein [Shimazuella kribbensis]|uniref:YybH family protein n=1 Tax=Shimazuella kribbensis TaxID=139808 RepID=UPI00040AB797|nr:nuclear transport factor 2 family protein [Shimazuella kribbensis]
MENKILNPAHINEAFANAYNEKDIIKLLALYESKAIHVTRDSVNTTGIENIKKDLEQLIGLNGKMTSVNLSTVIHDDIALLQAKFVLKDAGEKEVLAEGVTSEVLRRQADGSWRYIIDRPFSQTTL